MITLLVLLVTTALVTMATEDRSHLFHEHGFLLRDQGVVYLNTNNVYISIALHLAIPKFKFVNMGNDCHLELNCGKTRVQSENCEDGNWSDVLVASNNALTLDKQKVSKYKEIAHIKGSQKRSLGAILGIGTGLFSMIFSGITTARVSSHLNRVQSELDEFKSKQQRINGKIVEVTNDLVKIVDHNFKEVHVQMNNLHCKDAAVFQFSALKFSTLIWINQLNNIFYHVDRGSLGGKLNSFILSTDDLNKIMSEHDELKNTAYEDNVMNFYLATRVFMIQAEISADDNFLLVHYLIQTPLLYNENVHRLFKVEKVPLKIDNKCLYVNSPRYIYMKDDQWSFVHLNDESCLISDILSLCYETIPQDRARSNCIHKNEGCTFNDIP